MHTGSVEKLSQTELDEHLAARIAAITVQPEIMNLEGDLEENPDYAERVKYETERAKEGWVAVCTCEWKGNNPIPTKADAQEALQEHYDAVNAKEFSAHG